MASLSIPHPSAIPAHLAPVLYVYGEQDIPAFA